MGACVTPAKTQRIPLPGTNMNNSMHRSNQPSNITPDVRYSQQSGMNQQSQITLGNQQIPSNNYSVNGERTNNNYDYNRTNESYLLRSQRNLSGKKNYLIEPIIEQHSSSMKRISNQMSSSPRNMNSQSIHIETTGNFPPIIRKQSTTQIKQTVEPPPSIGNAIQSMVDSYNVATVQTPNFRGSAVNRLNQIVSYQSRNLSPQPLPLSNPFTSTVPVMHSQMNSYQNPGVDKRLLSFDKNMFKAQSTTPVPQSFRYNISLPIQTNNMF